MQTDLEIPFPPMIPLLCSSRMLLYHSGTPKKALIQCPCSEGIALTPCNNALPPLCIPRTFRRRWRLLSLFQ